MYWTPWRSYPPSVRWVFLVYSLCFLGASVVHTRDIWLGKLLPDPEMPLAFNVYWTSLAFFDFLAVVLFWTLPRTGIVLAVAIMVSDVAINSYTANWYQYNTYINYLPLQAQTWFLGFVLGTAPFVWSRLNARR